MNTLASFERLGKRGFYRPVEQVSFERAVDMVAEALRMARAQELTDILVNTCGLTGFASPSIFDRHAFAVKWAQAAGGCLHVALVARVELIDPEKIGVVMAQNRGMPSDVFTTEAAALQWLDARIVAAASPS